MSEKYVEGKVKLCVGGGGLRQLEEAISMPLQEKSEKSLTFIGARLIG